MKRPIPIVFLFLAFLLPWNAASPGSASELDDAYGQLTSSFTKGVYIPDEAAKPLPPPKDGEKEKFEEFKAKFLMARDIQEGCDSPCDSEGQIAFYKKKIELVCEALVIADSGAVKQVYCPPARQREKSPCRLRKPKPESLKPPVVRYLERQAFRALSSDQRDSLIQKADELSKALVGTPRKDEVVTDGSKKAASKTTTAAMTTTTLPVEKGAGIDNKVIPAPSKTGETKSFSGGFFTGWTGILNSAVERVKNYMAALQKEPVMVHRLKGASSREGWAKLLTGLKRYYETMAAEPNFDKKARLVLLDKALQALRSAEDPAQGVLYAKEELAEDPEFHKNIMGLFEAQVKADFAAYDFDQKFAQALKDPTSAQIYAQGSAALQNHKAELEELFNQFNAGKLSEEELLSRWPEGKDKLGQDWNFDYSLAKVKKAYEDPQAEEVLARIRDLAYQRTPALEGKLDSPEELIAWAQLQPEDPELQGLFKELDEAVREKQVAAVEDILGKLAASDGGSYYLNEAAFNKFVTVTGYERARLLEQWGFPEKMENLERVSRLMEDWAQALRASPDREAALASWSKGPAVEPDLQFLKSLFGEKLEGLPKDPELAAALAEKYRKAAEDIAAFLELQEGRWRGDEKWYLRGREREEAFAAFKKAALAAGIPFFDRDDYLAKEPAPKGKEKLALPQWFKDRLSALRGEQDFHWGHFPLPENPTQDDIDFKYQMDAMISGLYRSGQTQRITVEEVRALLAGESGARLQNQDKLKWFMDLSKVARVESAFTDYMDQELDQDQKDLMKSLGLLKDFESAARAREELASKMEGALTDWQKIDPGLLAQFRDTYERDQEFVAYNAEHLRPILAAKKRLLPWELGYSEATKEVRLDPDETGYSDVTVLSPGTKDSPKVTLTHSRSWDGTRQTLQYDVLKPGAAKPETLTLVLDGLDGANFEKGLAGSLAPGGTLTIGGRTFTMNERGRLTGMSPAGTGYFEGEFDFDEKNFSLLPAGGTHYLTADGQSYNVYDDKGNKVRGKVKGEAEFFWDTRYVSNPENRDSGITIETRYRMEGGKKIYLDAVVPKVDKASGKAIGYYVYAGGSYGISNQPDRLIILPEGQELYHKNRSYRSWKKEWRDYAEDSLPWCDPQRRVTHCIQQLVIHYPGSSSEREEMIIGTPNQVDEKRVYDRGRLESREAYEYEGGKLKSKALYDQQGQQETFYNAKTDATDYLKGEGEARRAWRHFHGHEERLVDPPLDKIEPNKDDILEAYYVAFDWGDSGPEKNVQVAKFLVNLKTGQREIADLDCIIEGKPGQCAAIFDLNLESLYLGFGDTGYGREEDKVWQALKQWHKRNRDKTWDDYLALGVQKAGSYLIAPLEVVTGLGTASVAYSPLYMLASYLTTGDLTASRALFAKGIEITAKNAVTTDVMIGVHGEEVTQEVWRKMYGALADIEEKDGKVVSRSAAGDVLLSDFRAVTGAKGDISAEAFYRSERSSGYYMDANKEHFRGSGNWVYGTSRWVGNFAITVRDVLAFTGPMGAANKFEAVMARGAKAIENPLLMKTATLGVNSLKFGRTALETRYMSAPYLESIYTSFKTEKNRKLAWIDISSTLSGLVAARGARELPEMAERKAALRTALAQGDLLPGERARIATALADASYGKALRNIVLQETASILGSSYLMDTLGLRGVNGATGSLLLYNATGGPLMRKYAPTGADLVNRSLSGGPRLGLVDTLGRLVESFTSDKKAPENEKAAPAKIAIDELLSAGEQAEGVKEIAEKLNERFYRDSTTKAGNMRYAQDRAGTLVEKYGQMVLIDLNLKHLNDAYQSHALADNVLKALTSHFQESLMVNGQKVPVELVRGRGGNFYLLLPEGTDRSAVAETILKELPEEVRKVANDMSRGKDLQTIKEGDVKIRVGTSKIEAQTGRDAFADLKDSIQKAHENSGKAQIQPGAGRTSANIQWAVRERGPPEETYRELLSRLDLEIKNVQDPDLREKLKRLKQDLEQQAYEDAMTGARNREWLADTLETLLSENDYLLAIDGDRFGDINRVFGEPVGDEVIKALGKVIRNQTGGRAVIRMGGEEFAIFFRGTKEQALELARQIKEAVKERVGVKDLARGMEESEIRKILLEKKPDLAKDPKALDETVDYLKKGNLTLSIGVVEIPGSAKGLKGLEAQTSLHDLMDSADGALYKAKEKGRDTVEFSGEKSKENQEKKPQTKSGPKKEAWSDIQNRVVAELAKKYGVGREVVENVIRQVEDDAGISLKDLVGGRESLLEKTLSKPLEGIVEYQKIKKVEISQIEVVVIKPKGDAAWRPQTQKLVDSKTVKENQTVWRGMSWKEYQAFLDNKGFPPLGSHPNEVALKFASGDEVVATQYAGKNATINEPGVVVEFVAKVGKRPKGESRPEFDEYVLMDIKKFQLISIVDAKGNVKRFSEGQKSGAGNR